MSQLDELLASQRAQQQKRQNAPNDQQTRKLFPFVHSRCAGRKIANAQVELKAHLDDPFYREARVSLRVVTSSQTAPEWLYAGDGFNTHNDLVSVLFVNGKYHCEGKTASGTPAVWDCDTPDDVVNTLEAYLAELA